MLVFPMSGGQWIAENRQPGSTPETQEHCVNGYEASSGKSRMYWDMSRLLTLHSPRLLQVSNRVFSKTPCWPRGQEPMGPASLATAIWQEKLSYGVESGCCWTSPSCSLWILRPHPPPFLPDLELRHQHLLWLKYKAITEAAGLKVSGCPLPPDLPSPVSSPVNARRDHASS